VCGLLLAASAVAAVAWWRLPLQPTPADCLRGRLDVGAPLRDGALLALLAAVVTALCANFTRRGARAGPFAAVAGAVLAAGPPLAAATAGSPAALVLGAGLGAALAVPVALPWLRERGLWSLAAVALVAATPHAVALRWARDDAAAARPIAAARAAAAGLPPDLTTVAVLLDDGIDEATRAALAVALAPRAVLAASDGSTPGQWLLRMELPVLRCTPERCTLAAAGGARALRPGALRIDAELTRAADGGLAGVAVRCDGARRGHLAILFGPAGTVAADFGENGRAVFDARAVEQLRGWLRPLPSAAALRILVVPPDPADVFGWTDLRP